MRREDFTDLILLLIRRTRISELGAENFQSSLSLFDSLSLNNKPATASWSPPDFTQGEDAIADLLLNFSNLFYVGLMSRPVQNN